ncbi:MAG: hypothetical protein E7176_02935 [Erysipelotrichaceae bacterium]|nr:hypothetical protein [Erysipelotrichaceae bacterium]
MIEFFDIDTCKGTASIYENHITFNKSMLKYFIDGYKARVGIDKENSKLYVFVLNKDYALSGEIPETSLLSISISKTYARICSRAMVEYVCKTFDLVVPKKDYIRYDATYDDKKKAIIIDMKGDM